MPATKGATKAREATAPKNSFILIEASLSMLSKFKLNPRDFIAALKLDPRKHRFFDDSIYDGKWVNLYKISLNSFMIYL